MPLVLISAYRMRIRGTRSGTRARRRIECRFNLRHHSHHHPTPHQTFATRPTRTRLSIHHSQTKTTDSPYQASNKPSNKHRTTAITNHKSPKHSFQSPKHSPSSTPPSPLTNTATSNPPSHASSPPSAPSSPLPGAYNVNPQHWQTIRRWGGSGRES